MNDVLASLRYLLGDRAVFLPVAFGDKKPTLAGWQKLTFAQSQTAEHRRALELAIARGGNLGCCLASRPKACARSISTLTRWLSHS